MFGEKKMWQHFSEKKMKIDQNVILKKELFESVIYAKIWYLKDVETAFGLTVLQIKTKNLQQKFLPKWDGLNWKRIRPASR